MVLRKSCPSMPSTVEAVQAPLRVLLIDDGAHRVSLIRDELTRQGHLVVGVLDSALLIHDCVLRLQPDVVIVDSESPTRDTLEHLATVSATSPRPVVVFSEDDGSGADAAGAAGRRQCLCHRWPATAAAAAGAAGGDRALRAGPRAACQLEAAQTQLSERKLVEKAKGVLMADVGCQRRAGLPAPAQAGDGPRPALGAGGQQRGGCARRCSSRRLRLRRRSAGAAPHHFDPASGEQLHLGCASASWCLAACQALAEAGWHGSCILPSGERRNGVPRACGFGQRRPTRGSGLGPGCRRSRRLFSFAVFVQQESMNEVSQPSPATAWAAAQRCAGSFCPEGCASASSR